MSDQEREATGRRFSSIEPETTYTRLPALEPPNTSEALDPEVAEAIARLRDSAQPKPPKSPPGEETA